MRSGMRGVAWLSLLWSVCSFSASAMAEESIASAQPAVRRASVRVRVVGALGKDAVLLQRIASWFDTAALEVKVEPAEWLDPRDILAPEAGAAVQVWVTRRAEKLARLYFASASAEIGKVRYLLRDLALERGLDEIAAEELAQSVHLSTVALLEGQLESSREEVEQALKTEAAAAQSALAVMRAKRQARPEIAENSRRGAAPVRAGVELAPALGYAVELRGDEGVAHGPRLRLSANWSSGFGIWSRLQVMLPHLEQLAQLELELWGGSLLLAPSFRRRLAPRWSAAGYAGPSLELVHYAARSLPGVAFLPSPPENELRPRVVVGALVAFGSSPRLALATELGLAFGRTTYEMDRSGERYVVAEASSFTSSVGLELEL